ncbi:MAG TPA: adenylate/guanylate cyclase domain-containing protein [Geminicoccus sp.]|jgi:adenylate cyclase|uniref:CHASE2 domain-containing protein n=1 Tax=Geminicoccus sp. TaxID=2024832 RepID=UPI002E318CC9|nr:adenylate/guanylate cyclase domain-containing protein [Geminicoccus sp.]HEX2528907.1 adenylate/guanylate cyclase domain-containing protein [Geminicoccus sp.]
MGIRIDKAPALAGLGAMVAVVVVHLLVSPFWRAPVLDRLLRADSWLTPVTDLPQAFDIVVIDIDRTSLDAIGPWPWPRTTMARLVDGVAGAGPAAIGTDILFADADQRSPAALARQLAGITGRTELAELAATLPDGDALMSEAVAMVPAALGFVLDPESDSTLPGPAFLTVGSPTLDGLWRGSGAIGPTPILLDAASGLGSLSLPSDVDGVVRQVPLLVAAGPVVLPGLALETLRLAFGSHVYRLSGDERGRAILDVGARQLRLPPGGLLRILPDPPGSADIVTIPAADILAGRSSGLQGSIVLIGGSAPELGGLRAVPGNPLFPSVKIQAHAVAQLMSGRIVEDPPTRRWIEPLGMALLATLAIALALGLGPVAGLVGVIVLCLAWSGGALLLLHRGDHLIDPAGPAIGAILVFATTAFTSFVATRIREQRLRQSFEQRLHPAVVERLVRRPGGLKLAGERRVATILITDLEDFTGLTHRAEPQMLISLLDRYLDGISRIVIDHGGMVDKLVGDAVHAIFNAPADLPGHEAKAVEAAIAVQRWTEKFRREAAVSVGPFGRTRVGVETGEVIVGDVGAGTRLDYTAYGDAVNMAVRLEGKNKDLGTSVIIGPVAASALPKGRLRPLGAHLIRGQLKPVELFTLPAETADAQRAV